MTSDSLDYTARLRQLVDERLAILVSLRELADVQMQQASDADALMLMNVLARKQPLMDELSRIQDELAVYALDDPETRTWRTTAARLECRTVAERCEQLLREILQLEQLAIEQLSQRRDAIAVQLQDGRDGRTAHAAYFTNTMPDQSALDLSSS